MQRSGPHNSLTCGPDNSLSLAGGVEGKGDEMVEVDKGGRR